MTNWITICKFPRDERWVKRQILVEPPSAAEKFPPNPLAIWPLWGKRKEADDDAVSQED